MSFAVLVLVFFILLLFSAFFSMSETALISVNKIRLAHGVREGSRWAKIAYDLVLHMDKVITVILILNNLVNTAIAAIGTSLMIQIFGPEAGILISTFVVTVFLLIFGEITPKVFSVSNADRVALIVALPMKFLVKVLDPVANVFTHISNRIVRLFGGKTRARAPLVTEEEMRFMIEAGKEEGIYGEMERKILHRIFEFGGLRVRDAMVPLAKVHAVPITATDDDLFNVCVEEGHSRVPVYQGTRDRIVGIVYTKDLLHLLLNKQLIKIPDVLNEPYTVSPEMTVSALLKEFLNRRVQIAIVSEHGRAVGLVTLEDLLEEIVGEIDEEPKRDPDPIDG
jgi:CBS domain containing-hemolysin-like protein